VAEGCGSRLQKDKDDKTYAYVLFDVKRFIMGNYFMMSFGMIFFAFEVLLLGVPEVSSDIIGHRSRLDIEQFTHLIRFVRSRETVTCHNDDPSDRDGI
jgi:hypothetical protein